MRRWRRGVRTLNAKTTSGAKCDVPMRRINQKVTVNARLFGYI